jgi:hypothetical protein
MHFFFFSPTFADFLGGNDEQESGCIVCSAMEIKKLLNIGKIKPKRKIVSLGRLFDGPEP